MDERWTAGELDKKTDGKNGWKEKLRRANERSKKILKKELFFLVKFSHQVVIVYIPRKTFNIINASAFKKNGIAKIIWLLLNIFT